CHVERNEHSECSRNIYPNVDKTLSRSFDKKLVFIAPDDNSAQTQDEVAAHAFNQRFPYDGGFEGLNHRNASG
ncbi:MAG: hypothetical protein MJ183_09765, partial [Treponemataceae bacterium]|nr:hypothetical protein [Treponemataceae bacterium]